ncbi:MAG: hypothetical protein HGA22_13985, partial [Clostridiales bacterium]|nr:hypothetical protein [Clostridiales bacterium]
VAYEVGTTLGGVPPLGDDATLMFFDLAQILTFANAEDAAAYPSSGAHVDLVEFADQLLKKVAGIDFEV